MLFELTVLLVSWRVTALHVPHSTGTGIVMCDQHPRCGGWGGPAMTLHGAPALRCASLSGIAAHPPQPTQCGRHRGLHPPPPSQAPQSPDLPWPHNKGRQLGGCGSLSENVIVPHPHAHTHSHFKLRLSVRAQRAEVLPHVCSACAVPRHPLCSNIGGGAPHTACPDAVRPHRPRWPLCAPPFPPNTSPSRGGI